MSENLKYAILRLDVFAFRRQTGVKLTPFQTLIAIHKYRAEMTEATPEQRQESRKWLEDNLET